MSLQLRRERAPKLAALARECAVILGDEPPNGPQAAANAAPAWTQRADVGG